MGNLSTGISEELVEGAYDWKKAMKDVLKVMIRMTAQMTIMKTISLATGGFLGGFGGLLFHDGGKVAPGSGNSPRRYHSGAMIRRNEVPAILERGEYVVNKRAARRPGALGQLEKINNGQDLSLAQKQSDVHRSYNFTINAIDSADMESVIYGKIIPLLEEAERRGAYSPGHFSS